MAPERISFLNQFDVEIASVIHRHIKSYCVFKISGLRFAQQSGIGLRNPAFTFQPPQFDFACSKKRPAALVTAHADPAWAAQGPSWSC